MDSRFRYLGLFSVGDSLRIAARIPRCAQGVLRDAVLGVRRCPFPRRIGLFLTNRCNFACPMCAVIDAREQGRGTELSFDIIHRVYQEAAAYGPAIDLIGGEPLLYSGIGEVFRLAARTPVLSVLTTNGLLLGDHAERMVEYRLPVLQVSLDGWDEDSQRLRGNVKGSFAKIVDGLAAVHRARGGKAFPMVRVLTAITRQNFDKLDRIQEVVHTLGVRYWGVANYFYVTESAMQAHRKFALQHGLNGAIAADAIAGDSYLSADQVRELEASLERVRASNRSLKLHISYAWQIDLKQYYSAAQPSCRCRCELPYNRLDVHADGSVAVCVSGKTLGRMENQSLGELWRGATLRQYREMYERSRPMPMCFRCCGLSQTVRFDATGDSR